MSSVDWPTADGQIIESRWIEHGGKGCHFDLRLHYTYVLDGRHYTGSNYRFGGECSGEDVGRITADNPVGKHVAVHYRPGHPGESVILPGSVSTNTAIGLVFMPIMIGACVYLMLVLHHERKKMDFR